MNIIFVFLFLVVNMTLYCVSRKWRNKQTIRVHLFSFIIDYYIFVIPIVMIILLFSFPFLFIAGNGSDSIMQNILAIEICLISLPVLFLFNIYLVYPNLQFVFFRKVHVTQPHQLCKNIVLISELILFSSLIPTIHYVTIFLVICISLFLQYKVVEELE